MKFWLNGLPSGDAQLASRAERGVAAATEFGAAAAGTRRTDAPTDENRKRKLKAIALIEFMLNLFIISFLISRVIFFEKILVM